MLPPFIIQTIRMALGALYKSNTAERVLITLTSLCSTIYTFARLACWYPAEFRFFCRNGK